MFGMDNLPRPNKVTKLKTIDRRHIDLRAPHPSGTIKTNNNRVNDQINVHGHV